MLQSLLVGRRRWLCDISARTTLQLLNLPMMRMALAKRHSDALLNHEAALPRLTGIDAQIVTGLKTYGIYMTTLDALNLADSDGAIQQASTLADGFVAEAHDRAAKGHVFITVPPERVAASPAIYHLGLQDRLLDIAENYIGLPPAYDGVTINYTIADGQEVATRTWHRDREDRQMLKVIIYLHDVDETGGPFELIRRPDDTQNDQSGYDYTPADSAELQHRLGSDYRDDILSCCGPAGTVIFADTARFFHRGKPATERDRIAVFYSYFASRPRHPFFCDRSGVSRDDVARLTTALPRRQQNAAKWRERLSPILKLIPPVPV